MDIPRSAAILLLAAPLLAAHGADGVPSHGQDVQIASCAGGPPITVKAIDERAFLDDAERTPLLADMLLRFPILARDRFEPPVILLWHKERDDWRYVSLQPNAFTRGGTLCFTATFVAKIFEQTPALRRKYFERGAADAAPGSAPD
jgi:hypothetical protein